MDAEKLDPIVCPNCLQVALPPGANSSCDCTLEQRLQAAKVNPDYRVKGLLKRGVRSV